ncbi:hypothetical protein Tco_0761917 [Tanacetum coccineum]
MIDDERARDNFLKDVCTFLRKFSRIPFGVTPKVILITWESFGEIKDALMDKQYRREDIQELMSKLLEDVRTVSEEFSEYINCPTWNRPLFYFDDDDDEYTVIWRRPKAITPDEPSEEPEDPLIMGEDELSTIPKKRITLVRDIPITSPKIDFLSEEFAGELLTLPSRIVREHEEYLSRMTLLCEISTSRSQENVHANPSSIIESLPVSLIPVEDSDPVQEEIDIFLVPGDLIPPGVANDDSEDENNSTFLPEHESPNLDHQDNPSSPRPPPEPPDVCLNFKPDTAMKNDEDFNQGEIILSLNVEDVNSFIFHLP